MGLLQAITGNAAEIPPNDAHSEFAPIMLEDEQVVKAYKLFRDMIIMTNFRIITLDKQGVSGKKAEFISIPYKSIKKFSKESAGFLDFDAELKVWLTGDSAPVKWEFSKGVNVNEAYQVVSRLPQSFQKSLNRSGLSSVYLTVCVMFLCPR